MDRACQCLSHELNMHFVLQAWGGIKPFAPRVPRVPRVPRDKTSCEIALSVASP